LGSTLRRTPVRRRKAAFPTASDIADLCLVPPLDPYRALFLDVDGTLLEIAPCPASVFVPSELPILLEDLARQRDGAVALVSGRPLDELDRLLNPWQGAAAGLHGIERRRADGTLDRQTNPAAAAALDGLRPQLSALAGAGTGLVLEDKCGTLALHYRAAPERGSEIRSLAKGLARQQPALRLIVGKMVVEFQPVGGDKGTAIAAFLTEPPFAGRAPIFIGDDVTDEDGFAEVSRRGGIAIRVGPQRRSRAAYALPNVQAVHRWLAAGRLRG
jgi:trehalose 6-phosphate phosphatase